jgi:precorrin-2 dehydrogenase/sirohydrochlorin ferrochelatase
MDLEVMAMDRYYPVMLDLRGKPCLVVGGGSVAARKITSLLKAGAMIHAVSPTFTAVLEDIESRGEAVLHRRPYQTGDCVGYTLIIAATNAAEVNEQVYQEASSQKIWVNVVDRPEWSSFIVPSVVRRGDLILSVSTGGASPSLARKIAGELEATYGDEYELYLEFLSEVRLQVQKRTKDKEIRQTMFKRMLEWDILEMIRQGNFESWKQELLFAMDQEPTLETVEAFCGSVSGRGTKRK